MTRVIIGPPGTGKTTRIGALVDECVRAEKRPLLCSLTRTAAGEIVRRGLPVHKDAIGTLHSHAFRALGIEREQVAESKIEEWNATGTVFALGDESRIDVDDPYSDGPPGSDRGAKAMSEYQVLRARMAPREQWPPDVRAFGDAWDGWKRENGLFDFTDMIEQAALTTDRAPGNPDVLFVDEAQDMSALELSLLRKWAAAAGDLVIVGDPWQALYTWRGAHPEMFNSDKVAPENRSVLAQSYRIPAAVHAAATEWIKGLSDYQPIEYRPRNEEGSVSVFDGTCKHPESVVDATERELAAGRSVMLCASCGYMLTRTVADLKRRGIPFANPWRLKRGDWNPLGGGKGVSMSQRVLDFLRCDETTFGPPDEPEPGTRSSPKLLGGARAWTYSELHRWLSVLAAKGLVVEGTKAFVQTMADAETQFGQHVLGIADIEAIFTPEAAGFLTAMLEGRAPTGEALVWYRSRLLATKKQAASFPLTIALQRGPQALRERPRVFVGTIHSFKGAEADTVFIYPDLSPKAWDGWYGGGEGRDSIHRMFYVALTRARHRVYLCRSGTRDCVDLAALANLRGTE